MSEPALRLKVSVPWHKKTLILRTISFGLDGYVSADFDTDGGGMSYFNYPAEFTLLEARKLKNENHVISDDGDGMAVLRKVLAQFKNDTAKK